MPRFDSTPVMPTFPRIEVSAANTAEPIAYRSQPLPRTPPGMVARRRSIIRYVPAPMIVMPTSRINRLSVSPSSTIAKPTVRMMLDLSTGATWLTSARCSARK